jgi:hypothetical protein
MPKAIRMYVHHERKPVCIALPSTWVAMCGTGKYLSFPCLQLGSACTRTLSLTLYWWGAHFTFLYIVLNNHALLAVFDGLPIWFNIDIEEVVTSEHKLCGGGTIHRMDSCMHTKHNCH